MTIEIWSDIVCPFCYIGKRRLEKALKQTGMTGQLDVVWKSFQLNPHQVTRPGVSVLEDLSNSKGWSMEQTRQITAQVTHMAATEGLVYNFDIAVVANSMRAHRLLQWAKTHGKGDAMKEALLRAYFVEGKNIDDAQDLIALAVENNLPADEARAVLTDADAFANEVQNDLKEAAQIGVRGVPFFVFDRKYAISGAQPLEVFVDTLGKMV